MNIHKIKVNEPTEYGYTDMVRLYTKQELADRLEYLYSCKHTIENKMISRSLSKYESEKFNSVTTEISSILSELLRDFSKYKED